MTSWKPKKLFITGVPVFDVHGQVVLGLIDGHLFGPHYLDEQRVQLFLEPI